MSVADEQRVTLPARAYVERDVFEAELDDVFARAWIFVCPERVVAEPGSFATASVAGEPVAVVRGDDGELRALSNVCRHRAMQILSGTGRCPKVLRCPYHGWTYRQDGRLAAVPEARGFPALDREARAPCRRSASSRWRGSCSSRSMPTCPRSPNGSATSASASSRSASRGCEAEGPLVVEYPYNWKNLADNYLEGYHIPVGHPGLLRMLDYKRYEPAARPAPCLDQRAAARQALGRPPRAPLPAARAAHGGLPRRPARDLGLRAPLPGAVPRPLPRPVRHLADGAGRARAHADRLLGVHARAGAVHQPRRAAHQLAIQRRGHGRGQDALRRRPARGSGRAPTSAACSTATNAPSRTTTTCCARWCPASTNGERLAARSARHLAVPAAGARARGPGAARAAGRPGGAGADAAPSASARSRSSCSRARPSAGTRTCARAASRCAPRWRAILPPAVRAAALRLDRHAARAAVARARRAALAAGRPRGAGAARSRAARARAGDRRRLIWASGLPIPVLDYSVVFGG